MDYNNFNYQQSTSSHENADKFYKCFFEKDSRKIGEQKLPYNLLEENFMDIFNKYNDDIFLHQTPEKDPFYNMIKCDENKEIENDKVLNIDDIFYAYLKEFYVETNADYFHFMFKFVIMFRQCINKLKDMLTFSGPDPANYYSKNNNTEGIPDLCNDFVTDFMEPKDYYGMETTELIEIIQHLCHWLFTKHYTTSRLTLV